MEKDKCVEEKKKLLQNLMAAPCMMKKLGKLPHTKNNLP